MRVLLDTHAFLWWVTDDPQLSSTSRSISDRYDGLRLRIYIDERKAIATTGYAYAQNQCFNYELVV
ncbi:MAG: hypothetical protein V7K27_15620 [Nostoc sp.]|uniref:hypothetical protein n=1 Tax=Nostoc sp. TaxID=1180 RepID=UPI002FFA0DA7